MNSFFKIMTIATGLGLSVQQTAFAQSSDDLIKQFQQSRKAMLDDYNQFRNSVLADYDKYLQGVWKEYQRFKADKLEQVPKPKVVPKYVKPTTPEKPVQVTPKKPVNKNIPIILPESVGLNTKPDLALNPNIGKVEVPVDKPDEPKPELPKDVGLNQKPDLSLNPNIGKVEVPVDVPKEKPKIDIPLIPALPTVPVMPALPNVPYVQVPSIPTVNVDYYGAKVDIPTWHDVVSMRITAPEDVATYWKLLKQSKLKEITPAIAAQAREMGLSDWATAMMVEKYVDNVMKDASDNEKIIAQQYILATCGYNIRLAMNSSQVTMLIPFAEHVYEKSYIVMDGKKYYIWPEINSDGSFRTCTLPKDAEVGKDIDLRFLGKTKIGNETKEFHFEYDDMAITGELNTGIMPLLNAYPVVDIPTVASCILEQDVRDQVVEQVKNQVRGLTEREAANKILRFVQKAFDYATDDEQFGKEKYFYFEETLYYPKNDCEDRAIFYAYLIHEILKLDVHLIHFTGHECTAVAFNENIEYGCSYEYKGKRYYICDPTYIGANIGKCIPKYRSESPQIEVWY